VQGKEHCKRDFTRGGFGLLGEDGYEGVGNKRIIKRIVVGCCRISEFGEDRGKRVSISRLRDPSTHFCTNKIL